MKKKSNQSEVTQKIRKGEQSFLHATQCLDLLHIAMKLPADVPYGLQIMMRTRIDYIKLLKGQ